MKRTFDTVIIVCMLLTTGIFIVSRPLLAQRTEAPLEIQPVTLSASDGRIAQFSFFHKPANQQEEQPLSDGSIIQLGDAYRISFTPLKNCHIYIFEHDASGRIVQLFPSGASAGSPTPSANPVREDTTYSVPSGSESWRRVKQPIIRHLSLVVSSGADTELEEQYRFMLSEQKAQDDFGMLLAQDELNLTIEAKNISRVTPVIQPSWIKNRPFQSPMIAAQILQVLRLPFTTRGGDFEEKAMSQEELKDLPTATLLNLFKRRTAEILPESKPVLFEYGKILQTELADAVIVIAAHTDNQGTPEANHELAQARAEAVQQFLNAHFQIAVERLPVYAYGGTQPLVSNENAEGRRLNNRIEFIRWK